MSLSQAKQILAWMESGNTITQLDATHRFGCTRLSARMDDIEKMLDDPSRLKRRMTKAANGKHYMLYWLAAPQGPVQTAMPFLASETRTPHHHNALLD